MMLFDMSTAEELDEGFSSILKRRHIILKIIWAEGENFLEILIAYCVSDGKQLLLRAYIPYLLGA